VEQIEGRLRDRFQLLNSGDRTAPLRQQTLRATVDWSYELLDEAEQMLLRRLAVFSGWNLDMAEQVLLADICNCCCVIIVHVGVDNETGNLAILFAGRHRS
jgi:hypothetical protein